ncbi:hypothetical protein IAG25_32595 [Caballeronia sp. EK]|uniref:hypothetical protein n=1 Tax=Caballeronia sp. EK TaxID=2767469 RepID=UPI0019AD15E6|nr:hypothetical protein [Caballeronia sp. EK]MBC8641564.1 hypothetical protein [Caballeronia sp. EK]
MFEPARSSLALLNHERRQGMDSNLDPTETVRADMTALLRKIVQAYRAAKTPQSEREVLLQLGAAREAMRLAEPLVGTAHFAELSDLDVSQAELAELLAEYWTHLMQPEEKTFLARIQNCALRAQVVDPEAGASRFFALMRELQRDNDRKLVLV